MDKQSEKWTSWKKIPKQSEKWSCWKSMPKRIP